MKRIFTTIAIVCSLNAVAQVCTDHGTSTNPNSPNAPTAPSNGPELWLNAFKWYGNDGVSLEEYDIHDLFVDNNQTTMNSAFEFDNPWYGHITNVPLELKDMRPEDGWELLSVNLGSYPNGELLTNNDEYSSFPEIPYLMLYNRNRGIIRLFANSVTGIDEGFDHVVVTLEFLNPSSEVSGLLRHNGLDQALDKRTSVKAITSVVHHPNNPMAWFQVDFQVGYDPCTCLFVSNLVLTFQFVEELELNMVSNTIETQIAAVNSDGSSNIPQDFLANVQYKNNFEGAGIIVYGTVDRMVDQYLERLEEVQSYNETIGNFQKKQERQKYVLTALKWAMGAGVNAVLPQSLGDSLAKYANHVLNFVAGGQETPIKLNMSELAKEANKILGKEVDYLGVQWFGSAPEKLPTPTAPAVSLSTTTFNGTLSNNITISGPSFFNPGTYPSSTGGYDITPHNYPVYNEILGLFALLETPKLRLAQSYESSFQVGSDQVNMSSEWQVRTYNNVYKYKFSLDKPLKYIFNPAAHINLDQVQIFAQIEAKHNVDVEDADIWDFSVDGELTNCWMEVAYPDINTHTFQYDNLDADLDYANPLEIHNASSEYSLEASTRLIPLNFFNTLVGEIQLNRVETFGLRKCIFNDEGTWGQGWSAVEQEHQDSLSDVDFYLKLMVVMPFSQLGSQGQQLETVQYFTYKFDNNNEIVLTDISDPELVTTWSFNANQNNGSMPTQEILELGEKTWTAADYAIYGGSDPQHIQVYATDRIIITGNQTIDPSILSVEFIATNEVVVQNEATLIGNFHLYLDDFVVMSSTPTSQVSATYLESFCSGQAPNSYHANLGTRANDVRPNEESNTPEQKHETFQARVYPTVVQSVGDVTVESTDPIQSVLVYNAIGVLVHSAKWEDQSSTTVYRMNTSDFSSGMYTVLLTNLEGDIVNRKLIVRR